MSKYANQLTLATKDREFFLATGYELLNKSGVIRRNEVMGAAFIVVSVAKKDGGDSTRPHTVLDQPGLRRLHYAREANRSCRRSYFVRAGHDDAFGDRNADPLGSGER